MFFFYFRENYTENRHVLLFLGLNWNCQWDKINNSMHAFYYSAISGNPAKKECSLTKKKKWLFSKFRKKY